MKKWFFWAGIGFLIGGIVSLSLNAAVEGYLSFEEDVTGYSLGWIAVGVVLLLYGLISKKNR